jgi:hypothetical protein
MKYNLRERCQINYNEAAEVAEQADAVGERARMRFCRQYRDQLNSELKKQPEISFTVWKSST